MRTLIEDWNFKDEGFTEFVGPTMQLLVNALKGCSELDSQTLVSRGEQCGGWRARTMA